MTHDRHPPDATPHILIVEDSPTQARRLEHSLQQQGYQVEHAGNGRLALDYARRHKPALIISDVIMPEMDGYELCINVKTDPDLGDIPVILVTTLSDPGDVIRGLQCRADNFILKPYDLKYLISRVRFVLVNREMRQAEQGGLGVEIFFNGQRHVITADRLQILNLLLSTYEAAIQRNKDLTRAQEETRRAESFLSSIIENVPSTIFVKDARELRYVRLNRAFEELVGRSRSEILGKTVNELFTEQEAQSFDAQDREALGQRVLIDLPEERIQTPRGIRILHTRKVPILDAEGTPRHLLGISEDVTDRKDAERALAAAKLEAERANRSKSQFLSRMSHDLRTPLNAILGFAQLLESDNLTPDQHDSVQHIIKGGAHLLDLINEVLDIARIESGHLSLSLEPVAVQQALRQAVELVRPLAAQRGVTVDDTAIRGDQTSHVLCDRQRLNQVLLNLLSNAVKYNRDGGRVDVSLEKGLDGPVRIKISDTGRGIAPAKLSLLFQPFERLGAEQTSVQGTGLGLALSKALSEAMGGTLGVESQEGRGSTFWLELAAAEAPVASAASPAGVRARASNGTPATSGMILYIEDNASNQRLMERVLRRRPAVRLVTVAQGEAGIERARTDAPDLILLDLHLPDIGGEEVLRRLLQDPRTGTIPVAVLSADATQTQQKRLIDAGAVAYLTKPLEIDAVLQLVDARLKPRSV